jgi:hypothetical protein
VATVEELTLSPDTDEEFWSHLRLLAKIVGIRSAFTIPLIS